MKGQIKKAEVPQIDQYEEATNKLVKDLTKSARESVLGVQTLDEESIVIVEDRLVEVKETPLKGEGVLKREVLKLGEESLTYLIDPDDIAETIPEGGMKALTREELGLVNTIQNNIQFALDHSLPELIKTCKAIHSARLSAFESVVDTIKRNDKLYKVLNESISELRGKYFFDIFQYRDSQHSHLSYSPQGNFIKVFLVGDYGNLELVTSHISIPLILIDECEVGIKEKTTLQVNSLLGLNPLPPYLHNFL